MKFINKSGSNIKVYVYKNADRSMIIAYKILSINNGSEMAFSPPDGNKLKYKAKVVKPPKTIFEAEKVIGWANDFDWNDEITIESGRVTVKDVEDTGASPTSIAFVNNSGETSEVNIYNQDDKIEAIAHHKTNIANGQKSTWTKGAILPPQGPFKVKLKVGDGKYITRENVHWGDEVKITAADKVSATITFVNQTDLIAQVWTYDDRDTVQAVALWSTTIRPRENKTWRTAEHLKGPYNAKIEVGGRAPYDKNNINEGHEVVIDPPLALKLRNETGKKVTVSIYNQTDNVNLIAHWSTTVDINGDVEWLPPTAVKGPFKIKVEQSDKIVFWKEQISKGEEVVFETNDALQQAFNFINQTGKNANVFIYKGTDKVMLIELDKISVGVAASRLWQPKANIEGPFNLKVVLADNAKFKIENVSVGQDVVLNLNHVLSYAVNFINSMDQNADISIYNQQDEVNLVSIYEFAVEAGKSEIWQPTGTLKGPFKAKIELRDGTKFFKESISRGDEVVLTNQNISHAGVNFINNHSSRATLTIYNETDNIMAIPLGSTGVEAGLNEVWQPPAGAKGPFKAKVEVPGMPVEWKNSFRDGEEILLGAASKRFESVNFINTSDTAVTIKIYPQGDFQSGVLMEQSLISASQFEWNPTGLGPFMASIEIRGAQNIIKQQIIPGSRVNILQDEIIWDAEVISDEPGFHAGSPGFNQPDTGNPGFSTPETVLDRYSNDIVEINTSFITFNNKLHETVHIYLFNSEGQEFAHASIKSSDNCKFILPSNQHSKYTVMVKCLRDLNGDKHRVFSVHKGQEINISPEQGDGFTLHVSNGNDVHLRLLMVLKKICNTLEDEIKNFVAWENIDRR